MKYNKKMLQHGMEGLNQSDQPQCGMDKPSMEAEAGKPNRGCGWKHGQRFGSKCAANAQGTDSEAVNMCQMSHRKMRMMREMMKAPQSDDNFAWNHHGFPGIETKQQCKRKHNHESNNDGNANEDKNSSTENQASCTDEENENNECGKSAGRWRKQMRQAAAMNTYMHPAFRPPFVMNSMSEARRKQMMRKWWKQMHKCEKPDAESTEKSAYSDENDVHVETKASEDCKRKGQHKTERQQCRQMRRRAMAFGTGLGAGSGSVYLGKPINGKGPMHCSVAQNHMNVWQNSFPGFPEIRTKQQCKRKYKNESNASDNANEDQNSSTVNQASCTDEENENNKCGKPAGKWRKQMRQTAAMNAYMHPAFRPPFVMNSMSEAGRKQMMCKWWKQMHKCEKPDAESTEKSASSDVNENDVHVETEASTDCKTEDQQKTERQQRRQMRRRAMALFATGISASDDLSSGPPFVGLPREVVRAFIKKQMRKNNKMNDNGEESKEENSSDEIVVADCCESTSENTPFGEKSEKSIRQEESETDPDKKNKSERLKCHRREMKRAMNAYMFPGLTGGMYGPANGYMAGGGHYGPPPSYVHKWMQRQVLRQQKKTHKQAQMSEDNIQQERSDAEDQFENIEVDN